MFKSNIEVLVLPKIFILSSVTHPYVIHFQIHKTFINPRKFETCEISVLLYIMYRFKFYFTYKHWSTHMHKTH